jgi:hypothetical protein
MRRVPLEQGRRGGVQVEGAKFPPAKRQPPSERQARRPLVVPTTKRPRLLREPSRPGDVARAGDRDPVATTSLCCSTSTGPPRN